MMKAEEGEGLRILCPTPLAGHPDSPDETHAAAGAGGGFLLDQGAPPDDDGDAGAPARRREGGDGEGESGVISPRKRQRMRNLRLAKGMDKAREKDIAVMGCWIPSVP